MFSKARRSTSSEKSNSMEMLPLSAAYSLSTTSLKLPRLPGLSRKTFEPVPEVSFLFRCRFIIPSLIRWLRLLLRAWNLVGLFSRLLFRLQLLVIGRFVDTEFLIEIVVVDGDVEVLLQLREDGYFGTGIRFLRFGKQNVPLRC